MSKKEGDIVSSKDKSALKKATLDAIVKKIDYYSNKNNVTDIDLYYLVKDFFREFLELSYEFSLEELLLELDKIYLDDTQRTKTTAFVKKIIIIEYIDKSFSEDSVKLLIQEFAIVARLLLKINIDRKKGFMNSLKSFFLKDEKSNEIVITKNTESNQNSNTTSGIDSLTTKEFLISSESLKTNNDENTITITNDLASSDSEHKLSETYLKQTKTEKTEIKSDETSKKENKKYNKAYDKAYDKSKDSTTKYSKNITPTNSELNKITPETNKYDWGSESFHKKLKEDLTTKSSISSSNTPLKEEPKQEDFQSILAKAMKLNKKSEVMELYKKINNIYENESIEFQTAHYDDIMKIYTRITQMK
ncbi:MAG: hypothetical protein WC758_02310 [Candidatus Woesearchaeota archaeon]|jgi:hypothetical protein